eukprot:6183749-Prymnesium_polylepis.1
MAEDDELRLLIGHTLARVDELELAVDTSKAELKNEHASAMEAMEREHTVRSAQLAEQLTEEKEKLLEAVKHLGVRLEDARDKLEAVEPQFLAAEAKLHSEMK